MRDLFGPFQRLMVPVGGSWSIVAQQIPLPAGEVAWDVFASHVQGARVPYGCNLHLTREKRDAEMLRLECLIDWPKKSSGA